MSSSGDHLEKFVIPLEEIHSATKHFGIDNMLQIEGFSEIYRGQLSEHWQNRIAAFKRLRLGFYNEIEMMSRFNHENLIRLIGYCDEDNELIMVSEYAIHGSLDQHLQDTTKRRTLTWPQRLKICLGVAQGLNYLHSGHSEHNRVVHGDIKSASILLDENLEAKICSFGLSIFLDQSQQQVHRRAAHSAIYNDWTYNKRGVPTIESDVYSFGWVLFEILSGMLAYGRRMGDDKRQSLSKLVELYYENKVDGLIDPHIRDHINTHSFHIIKDIAAQCISFKLTDRPMINMITRRIEEALHIQTHGVASTSNIRSHQHESLESYLIPLKDIIFATKNFDPDYRVGDGGFGVVYRAQLSKHWQNCTVAIKRLNHEGHQGKNEFLTEIKLISRFNHENIIPFVGYCDEENEMILVYEYASNSSLDHHLYDPNKRGNLTWEMRLKICLGAARGLNYLHWCLGEHNRVIHRDVKSGNILLDDNMEAKICDFGLSKEGPRNQQNTQIYTKAAGTNFYMCPIYRESNILRKESDVYSFGVVLFEMLSGMLAYHQKDPGDGNPQFLISLVRRYFKEGVVRLIDPLINDQIDSRCLHTFKDIAYQCISYNLEERPTMGKIVESIEDAMIYQKLLDPRHPIQQQESGQTIINLLRNAKAVRLRSHHGKFLYADEDQESVSQNHNGTAKNNIWTIEFVNRNLENTIRLKSCYDKYLTVSMDQFLLGMVGKKVIQAVLNRLDSSVEWEPIEKGEKVKLRTRYGNYLRANDGLLSWRNSVTHDIPHRSPTQDWIMWQIEIVDIPLQLSAPTTSPSSC